ncbi:uncharacterized protein LOC106156073 isoform X2 [Lingula anatina]|uniref:Uncharacterized protein LOC106156073 isoform X2 n=1 Tax=Lingula anatina TaxID=7574 RepID=A0A1S3HKJ7_LINAN|nr:uncharacterized protein LOC106156073 isoform X2 [Lingula anatina]|eukprot:XP_013386635.1 uncharacterized protein LOC106156073 isoform X2 [Lingula anatina]
MLKISRLDINLPADLVQTCAGVRESQLCKFIATNSQGEFQHSIEVRGKQNNVISLELSNLSISFQDGHFVAEVEQALKVFQGRSETENEAVIPDAHVTSSQNAELESSHSDSGQPPDQVTPQDHYVSQVPMATNVTQGHQPTPEPSPRRLFRNISRKRPAETVTSGAMKFPRIIQEERLPSLTSGTTTTALTQQTHSDTKQTEEVSVEESRHDIVEVKVETDDDDYEDLTGAIDDNTGDSANKPSSSYVHSVPMVSQALASQHVVLGHSSSSTGHHTGQHTAVQHSGQAIARRQEQAAGIGAPRMNTVASVTSGHNVGLGTSWENAASGQKAVVGISGSNTVPVPSRKKPHMSSGALRRKLYRQKIKADPQKYEHHKKMDRLRHKRQRLKKKLQMEGVSLGAKGCLPATPTSSWQLPLLQPERERDDITRGKRPYYDIRC